LPVAGYISDLPNDIVSKKVEDIQNIAASFGIPFIDASLSLATLTTAGIPFIRICEAGLMNIRENKIVGLFPNRHVNAI
jgi:adenine deaminase